MRRILSLMFVFVGMILMPIFTAYSVLVTPAPLDLKQAPGTTRSYTLTVENNTTETEEIKLYLGDWLRYPDGEHDWDIPSRGARWNVPGPFAAEEVASVVYRVKLHADVAVEVTGWFRMCEPGLGDPITGSSTLTADMIGEGPEPPPSDEPWIGRRILEIDPDGVATVELDIHCPVECAGITLYEEFSRSVHIEPIDSAGGDLYTVNHSCIDWIDLSVTQFRLEPDESREVGVTVNTPLGFSGLYWATIFAESQPTVNTREGVQVSNIYRTAIKVYVTAPGTEELAGEVTSVVVTTDGKLEIQFSFSNTGKVQLSPTGTIDVIDRSGVVASSLPIERFYVLPGSYAVRTLTAEPLTSGIYQARVILDYGGDNPVGGVRTFKVE
jgi:hypothetical protein